MFIRALVLKSQFVLKIWEAKCDRLLPRCSTCVKRNRSCLTPKRKSEFVWLNSGIGEFLDYGIITSFLPVRKHHTSPWEFIHVPKVHEILGEAMISGEVTHARMGLFFVVLGASAFHLHEKTRNPENYISKWMVLGEEYRLRARRGIRFSLANLSMAMPAEQVADIVLVLTSMYNICVSYFQVKVESKASSLRCSGL